MWKIDGDSNIADLGTKALAKDRFETLLNKANIKLICDVEKIPETKVIGRVQLDAGSSAPVQSQQQLAADVQARALVGAIVALLQPLCARS